MCSLACNTHFSAIAALLDFSVRLFCRIFTDTKVSACTPCQSYVCTSCISVSTHSRWDQDFSYTNYLQNIYITVKKCLHHPPASVQYLHRRNIGMPAPAFPCPCRVVGSSSLTGQELIFVKVFTPGSCSTLKFQIP